MSQTIIWGTNLNANAVLRRRRTSTGTIRTTAGGVTRVVLKPVAEVIYYRRTSQSDQRVTSAGDDRRLDSGPAGPAYFATTNDTSDGGEPFAFAFTTDPWQPSKQGGENVFAWAYITLSWSLGASVRVTPQVDEQPLSEAGPNGLTLRTVQTVFQLPQQGGTLQRISDVFAVPLVRALENAEGELSRYYLRGERLILTIESTGPLGQGECMLEAIEVEFEPVRKAIYATVDSSNR